VLDLPLHVALQLYKDLGEGGERERRTQAYVLCPRDGRVGRTHGEVIEEGRDLEQVTDGDVGVHLQGLTLRFG
jgi:hypothetical protein